VKKPKPRHLVQKEYMVPVRLTFSGTVYIKADSEDEALELLNRGEWDTDEIRGLQDWEITGPAVENK
jgi:glutamine synthetase type III